MFYSSKKYIFLLIRYVYSLQGRYKGVRLLSLKKETQRKLEANIRNAALATQMTDVASLDQFGNQLEAEEVEVVEEFDNEFIRR